MDNFVRVEGGAPFFPHTCRACFSGKDLLDTVTEDVVGRLYICRACIENGARVTGMIEGNRHSELMQADDSLRRIQASLEAKDKVLEVASADIAELERLHAVALEELATARQRITQLEDATRARAAEELALVGVGAPSPLLVDSVDRSTEGRTLHGEERHGTPNNEKKVGYGYVAQEDGRDRSGEGDPED